MYARVTELKGINAIAVDNDLRLFEDEILPQMESIPGMSGGLVLVDRDRGTALAISLWADEETLADSRETADTLRDLALQRMNFTNAPIVREYEVGVAQLAQAVAPAGR